MKDPMKYYYLEKIQVMSVYKKEGINGDKANSKISTIDGRSLNDVLSEGGLTSKLNFKYYH